jgi:hypothetical protein
MRRTIAVAGVVLATALAVTPSLPTFADEGAGPVTGTPTVAEAQADRALAVASRVLAGDAAAVDPEPTMALLDLRQSLPDLSPSERRTAQALLARPTDGPADEQGDGYTVPATKKCSTHVCVHYVTSTPDAPPAGWVDETLTQLNKVWRLEVDTMGYRRPLADHGKGGNDKLDVYLKDVGPKGYYGYCTTERKAYRYTYSGYCVLDDDFDPAQFGGAPALNSLKVTAAHEFFHAVQYAYDAAEDRWFMESTATWMEERFADGVNDNLQYLPSGQLGAPQTSLDTFTGGGFAQYGNWAWWEYLSGQYGNGLVKTVWNKAGAYRGAPDQYSTQALVGVLKSKGGFKKNFGTYASNNTAPAHWYEEGATWPTAPSTTKTLMASAPSTGTFTLPVNHLASKNVKVVAGASLAESNWALRVTIDAPSSSTSPTVVALITRKDGTMSRRTISLSTTGAGTSVFGFDAPTVSSVTLTLANASTRFTCWKGTSWSCMGNPKDDAKPFTYTATAFQR